MDYFAHGFWSYIFFHRRKKAWLAVILGLLPDSLSWGIFFLYNLFYNGFAQPHLGTIPNWVYTLYGISHSIFVWILVFFVAYYFFKRKAFYLLAPLIAIFMDIPTHTREFLPTPFLWPFSEWYFPGISWGTPLFMIVNYSVIVLCLFGIIGYGYWKKKNL